jgi:hypothetical protein
VSLLLELCFHIMELSRPIGKLFAIAWSITFLSFDDLLATIGIDK